MYQVKMNNKIEKWHFAKNDGYFLKIENNMNYFLYRMLFDGSLY